MIEPNGANRPQHQGRLNKLRIKEDEARYKVAAGMAKVALLAKRERAQLDVHKVPLYYANRMAKGHNEATLERIAAGSRRAFSAFGPTVSAVHVPWPWQKKKAPRKAKCQTP